MIWIKDDMPDQTGKTVEGGYHGYPTLAIIQENALDEVVATKRWALAEQITGVHFPLH